MRGASSSNSGQPNSDTYYHSQHIAQGGMGIQVLSSASPKALEPEAFTSALKRYYNQQTVTRLLDEPEEAETFEDFYTHLALIRESGLREERIAASKELAQASSALQAERNVYAEHLHLFEKMLYTERTPIEEEHLFSPLPGDPENLCNTPIERVLVRGQAGIGKTTFCYHYAQKLINQGEWAVVVPLRSFQEGDEALDDTKVIIKALGLWPEEEQISLSLLLAEVKEKLYWVLDGYDEVANMPESHPISRWLKVAFKKSRVILTTRPTTVEGLMAQRRVEMIGYLPEDVLRYISNYFRLDKEKGEQLKIFLNAQKKLEGISRVPIVLELLCWLWKENSFLTAGEAMPFSLTKLYTHIFIGLGRRYLKRFRAHLKVDSLTDEEVIKQLECVGITVALTNLALNSLRQDKFILTGKEITEYLPNDCSSELREKVIEHFGFIRRLYPSKHFETTQFSFMHLTFQEYFAARYIANEFEKNEEEIKNFIQMQKYNLRYKLIFGFVAGLLVEKPKILKAYLDLLITEPRDLSRKQEAILLMHCLNECSEIASELDNNKAVKIVYAWIKAIFDKYPPLFRYDTGHFIKTKFLFYRSLLQYPCIRTYFRSKIAKDKKIKGLSYAILQLDKMATWSEFVNYLAGGEGYRIVLPDEFEIEINNYFTNSKLKVGYKVYDYFLFQNRMTENMKNWLLRCYINNQWVLIFQGGLFELFISNDTARKFVLDNITRLKLPLIISLLEKLEALSVYDVDTKKVWEETKRAVLLNSSHFSIFKNRHPLSENSWHNALAIINILEDKSNSAQLLLEEGIKQQNLSIRAKAIEIALKHSLHFDDINYLLAILALGNEYFYLKINIFKYLIEIGDESFDIIKELINLALSRAELLNPVEGEGYRDDYQEVNDDAVNMIAELFNCITEEHIVYLFSMLKAHNERENANSSKIIILIILKSISAIYKERIHDEILLYISDCIKNTIELHLLKYYVGIYISIDTDNILKGDKLFNFFYFSKANFSEEEENAFHFFLKRNFNLLQNFYFMLNSEHQAIAIAILNGFSLLEKNIWGCVIDYFTGYEEPYKPLVAFELIKKNCFNLSVVDFILQCIQCAEYNREAIKSLGKIPKDFLPISKIIDILNKILKQILQSIKDNNEKENRKYDQLADTGIEIMDYCRKLEMFDISTLKSLCQLAFLYEYDAYISGKAAEALLGMFKKEKNFRATDKFITIKYLQGSQEDKFIAAVIGFGSGFSKEWCSDSIIIDTLLKGLDLFKNESYKIINNLAIEILRNHNLNQFLDLIIKIKDNISTPYLLCPCMPNGKEYEAVKFELDYLLYSTPAIELIRSYLSNKEIILLDEAIYKLLKSNTAFYIIDNTLFLSSDKSSDNAIIIEPELKKAFLEAVNASLSRNTGAPNKCLREIEAAPLEKATFYHSFFNVHSDKGNFKNPNGNCFNPQISSK